MSGNFPFISATWGGLRLSVAGWGRQAVEGRGGQKGVMRSVARAVGSSWDSSWAQIGRRKPV